MSPVSRGFRRRRPAEADAARISPGQCLTPDFPVLSAGTTPRTPRDEWSLSIEVMFGLAAPERSFGLALTRADRAAGAGRGDDARTDAETGAPEADTSGREIGPKITALLEGGPLGGQRIEVDVVEGRPPKTIDVRADDGNMCRYCLEGWTQSGPSARYTFLYRV